MARYLTTLAGSDAHWTRPTTTGTAHAPGADKGGRCRARSAACGFVRGSEQACCLLQSPPPQHYCCHASSPPLYSLETKPTLNNRWEPCSASFHRDARACSLRPSMVEPASPPRRPPSPVVACSKGPTQASARHASSPAFRTSKVCLLTFWLYDIKPFRSYLRQSVLCCLPTFPCCSLLIKPLLFSLPSPPHRPLRPLQRTRLLRGGFGGTAQEAGVPSDRS